MVATSKSERNAAPLIAKLGGIPCASFAPHLSTTYLDADNSVQTGLPDYLIQRGPISTFIEWKAGKLNNHYTKASSHRSLQNEYNGPEQSYNFLSKHFWSSTYRSGVVRGMNHCFNQSLWKVLAIQAEHGWRRYIVCFADNPKPEDAKRYAEAGLIWCTVQSLDQLMLRIELSQSGCPISFIHRTRLYEYEVIFDNGTASHEEARTHFLATVEHSQAAEVAREHALFGSSDMGLADGVPF